MAARDPLLPAEENPDAVALVPSVEAVLDQMPDGIDYWALRDAVIGRDGAIPDLQALMTAVELVIDQGGVEWGHPRRYDGNWRWDQRPEGWVVRRLAPGTVLCHVSEDARPTAPRLPSDTGPEAAALMNRLRYRIVGEDESGQSWVLSLANSDRVNTLAEAERYLGRQWTEVTRLKEGGATTRQVTITSLDVERRVGDERWLITDRLVLTSGGVVGHIDVMAKRHWAPRAAPGIDL